MKLSSVASIARCVNATGMISTNSNSDTELQKFRGGHARRLPADERQAANAVEELDAGVVEPGMIASSTVSISWFTSMSSKIASTHWVRDGPAR